MKDHVDKSMGVVTLIIKIKPTQDKTFKMNTHHILNDDFITSE
jgi:hypothetical protein